MNIVYRYGITLSALTEELVDRVICKFFYQLFVIAHRSLANAADDLTGNFRSKSDPTINPRCSQ